jgi:penicillin amidase
MRSIGRFAAAIAVAALCGCAASRFMAYRTSPDGPGYAGDFALRGLDGRVRIVFDEHAVPHVEASSRHDLAFALGYLHGRERLFQMDLLRHLAYGRMSELFGNHRGEGGGLFTDTLAMDRFFKVAGIGRAGDRLAARLPEESRAMIEAYVSGINAYVYTGLAPIEHRLLDAVPGLWTTGNVVAVARLNAWMLSENLATELIRYVLRAELGPERQQDIFPVIEHPGPAIVERGDHDYRGEQGTAGTGTGTGTDTVAEGEWRGAAEAVLEALADVRDRVAPLSPPDASNNWVIGPGRTASGKPILANDPHLSHQAPGTMYLVHLKAPGVDVAGVTLPGAPAVVLGHNRHFAWAATTTFADVQDVYLEKVDPSDPGRYLAPGGAEPFRTVRDDVVERDGSSLVRHPFTVRYTRHGPVLNDAVDPARLPKDSSLLAVKWTLEEEADDIAVMWKLATAGSVADFREAMKGWAVPLQNWLAADDQGHIGYFPAGRVPIRRGWDGTMPVPGWTGEFEWDGFIPYDELPQLWDPPSGRIVTANNKVVPPGDYPWPFSLDAAAGYRAARIARTLDAKAKWTADDVRRLQTDVHVEQADRLLPPLMDALATESFGPLERAAYDRLAKWDRVAGVDSVGMTVYWATYRMAWGLALDDDLPRFAAALVHTFQYSYAFFDRLWAEQPHAKVWDARGTPGVEDRDAILRAAFRKGVEALAANYGHDLKEWRWGRVHTIEFRHPFGGDVMTRGTFNVGPAPLPGYRDTVWNAGGAFWEGPFACAVEHGPVFRHVIDFGDPQAGGMVVDLGNSGWPATAHYADGFDAWRDGRLWKVGMDPAEYTPRSIGALVLVPAR